MPAELIILLVMLTMFAISVFWWKFPAGLALALSSVAGALVAGEGFPVRHLVEGMFGYLDAILIIATAMVFMKAMEASGALGTIGSMMIRALYRWPTVLMIVLCRVRDVPRNADGAIVGLHPHHRGAVGSGADGHGTPSRGRWVIGCAGRGVRNDRPADQYPGDDHRRGGGYAVHRL